MSLRASLLGLGHIHRALDFVKTRRTDKTLGHQVQRTAQFSLRRYQHRVRLRHKGLRTAAPGAAQAAQARAGLAFASLTRVLFEAGLLLDVASEVGRG